MHKAAAHAKRGLPLRHLPAMDLPFLVLVLTLVGFGLVMLGSASSAVALYRRGDAWAYVRPQLLYAALGIGAMWMASRVDYHIYHKLAWPLLALSMVLLTAVLFMPEYNGCKRWLVLPGLGTLQPSEIAKFAVVLVFAHIIALNHDRMGSFAVGVLPFALVLGAVAVLMLLEPHLSGTVLILGIGAVLMFVGGTGLKWFVLAGAGGAAAIGAAIIIMPDLVPYAASRLSSWLDPFADPLGDGHQPIQSLYAIGSGGAAGQMWVATMTSPSSTSPFLFISTSLSAAVRAATAPSPSDTAPIISGRAPRPPRRPTMPMRSAPARAMSTAPSALARRPSTACTGCMRRPSRIRRLPTCSACSTGSSAATRTRRISCCDPTRLTPPDGGFLRPGVFAYYILKICEQTAPPVDLTAKKAYD